MNLKIIYLNAIIIYRYRRNETRADGFCSGYIILEISKGVEHEVTGSTFLFACL